MKLDSLLSSLVALTCALAVGCSDSEQGSADSSSAGTKSSGEREWTTLIQGSWTLGAGEEIPELCIQEELEEDVYISAIRPVHPPGTHHTLLSASDGTTGCNASLAGNGLLYGAGVGSEGIDLPPGVALKVPAGKTLNLGLHLFNTTVEDLAGTSAIEIVRVDESEVKHEAEAVLAGPFDISIPPGRHTMSDECTLEQEQTIFAIFPHMHQLGSHFRASFVQDGEETVVHDEPYFFEEQFQIELDEPMELEAGDSIVTECTWENPTAKTVTFGESSDTEMCFDIVFQYPARGSAFCGSGTGTGEERRLDGPPCAEEDDSGNDEGVGRYCTEGGDQCAEGASLCLADYTSGQFGNFCTKLCSSDEECGEGAVCAGSGSRAVCFPAACAESLSEAADAGAGDGGAGDGGTRDGG